MKALIIGYGSAGKHHELALSKFDFIESISIVSHHSSKNKVASTLSEIQNLEDYDYFVISSETHLHYSQLNYLNSNLKNKFIFCEKPLFHNSMTISKNNNKIFVGYVLRFHPLIKRLKNEIKNEKIVYANIYCGQYLPSWRKDRDYKNTYSADLKKGGGVLLDLSHELDICQWLFGTLSSFKVNMGTFSDLKISSEDLVNIIGHTKKNTALNISLDYISRKPKRQYLIHTNNKSIEVDLKEHQIFINKNIDQQTYHKLDNFNFDDLFFTMHEDIIYNKGTCCKLIEAETLMNYIDNIREKSH